MANGYQVEFESSYFSNGFLLFSLLFVTIGLGVAIAAIKKRFPPGERKGCSVVGVTVWCIFWLSISLTWLVDNLRTGWIYRSALREGRCKVVEGVVEVLHEQPWSGHDPGDRIRIDGQEFEYSDFRSTQAYNRTISHGGVLKSGTKARIHHLDKAILKVEVAK